MIEKNFELKKVFCLKEKILIKCYVKKQNDFYE